MQTTKLAGKWHLIARVHLHMTQKNTMSSEKLAFRELRIFFTQLSKSH